MNNIKCNLCAGSPSITLYPVLHSNKEDVFFTDVCIGKEIQMLNNNGVETVGCCCGHGDDVPTCLVSIDSKDILSSLGYEMYSFSPKHDGCGIKEIELKTDIQSELRLILSQKIFNYLPKMIPQIKS